MYVDGPMITADVSVTPFDKLLPRGAASVYETTIDGRPPVCTIHRLAFGLLTSSAGAVRRLCAERADAVGVVLDAVETGDQIAIISSTIRACRLGRRSRRRRSSMQARKSNRVLQRRQRGRRRRCATGQRRTVISATSARSDVNERCRLTIATLYPSTNAHSVRLMSAFAEPLE
jgi:hypothetical protein